MIGMKHVGIAFGTFCAFLVAVPSALASVGSVQEMYSGTAGVSQAQVASTQVASSTSPSSSALPFTGLDLMLLVGGGLLLLLTGVALYLISRPRVTA
jgi:hypothetical protein